MDTSETEPKNFERNDSLLGKEGKSKLLQEESRTLSVLDKKASAEEGREAERHEKIYAEREKLNALFENEDEAGVRAIEERGQTTEEKVASLEVAESGGMEIRTTTLDKDPNPPYGVPTFLEEDNGRLFLEANGYGMPVDFSEIESVKF